MISIGSASSPTSSETPAPPCSAISAFNQSVTTKSRSTDEEVAVLLGIALPLEDNLPRQLAILVEYVEPPQLPFAELPGATTGLDPERPVVSGVDRVDRVPVGLDSYLMFGNGICRVKPWKIPP